jgi:hypothetical protein
VAVCPADINVSNDPGVCSAVVAFSATVTDNCPGATISCIPSSGSTFPVGTTLVTCTATDTAGNTDVCTFDVTVVDNENPTIVCPSNISVNADAGVCTAYVTVPSPTTGDNCGVASVINDYTGTSDASGTYPSGVTTVTWTVTDVNGNTAQCSHTVTVSAFNELVVDVELSPNVDTGSGSYPQTLTRCITFELWGCPASSPAETVSEEIVFTKAGAGAPMITAAGQVVEVPCGSYSCITARDELHTLRRTDETFGIVGTQYVADFAGDPAGGGDWLVGGNLNDDRWIDILDFGVFAGQWSVSYGTGDTTCSMVFPHADISGDGSVGTGDFGFIQVNFLLGNEANCCGAPGLAPPGDGPVTEISVAELYALGLGHLAAADLNGDAMLDQADVQAFLMGARPQQVQQAPPMQRRPLRPGRAR